MSKQSFTTGQVLTAAQVNSLQANDFNQTVSVKTANYTLAAADKGTRIEFNTSGSVSCTVNSGLFDAGDTLVIQNRGAGTATITAGTATVNTSASLALAQYSAGTLYFVSASAALFFGDAAGISASIVDAKGDLIVGTADNTVARLAVGTDGHTLVADSVETTGLKWAAPAAGGMTLLSTTSVSSQSTVTISSISGSYTNLQVWIEGANLSDNDGWIRLAPNASTTLSNHLQAVSTVSGTTALQDGRNGYYPIGKSTSMGNSDASSAFILNFFNYAGSQAVKIITENAYYKNNQGSYGMTMVTGSFVSSSAISSLVFSVPSGTYSATIKVYGVK